ncbi:MAG: hypothetical protein GY806_16285 [Gammaproteobacteria bacterium]|nr:hypothetical protein [Gammaproteobacteria bacterium]
MKLALDRFADNPVIDELICRTDTNWAIKSLRACAPIWRKPFIEIEYSNSKKIDHMHFAKELFIHYWSEATVILETLTDIELISEFKCHSISNRKATVETILSTRNACIRECDNIFESGIFQVYLDQFGPNCKNLPDDSLQKIKTARANLD